MNTKPPQEKADITKIKRFLHDLGFICRSFPTASNLIYVKNGETIIIKKFIQTDTTKSDQK